MSMPTMFFHRELLNVKFNGLVLLVILLCASLVLSSNHAKLSEDVILKQLLDPMTGEVDEDLAGLLWMSCRSDFFRLKEANSDNLCLPEEIFCITHEIDSKSRSLAKETIQQLFKFAPLQLKQTILDCIRQNHPEFHVSRDEGGSNIRDSKYLTSPVHRHVYPMRNLLQSIAEAPSPSSELSPGPAPSLSPLLAPSPASPAPAPDPALPPEEPFFPQLTASSPPPEKSTSEGPIAGPFVEEDTGDNNNRPIIIAVAVTAAVSFVAAALFFFFCTRFCRKGYAARRNDERPLLSLSLSDYTGGSTHKPSGLGNSINEEKLGHQSLSHNTSLKRKGSSLDSNYGSDAVHTSLNVASSFGAVNGLVPPPPGRAASTPLKPTPGRADPLPHEPPASLRPTLSMADPPPPPAPAPAPPPPPKASGSAGSTVRGPPPPPPMVPGKKPGPPPPPPPKAGGAPRPPPPMPAGPKAPRPPVGSKFLSGGTSSEGSAESKAKLKPFFWDKVMANPDQSMVWHQIKAGSFQFNEEMIETLFGAAAENSQKGHKRDSSQDQAPQYIQLLDYKKAQNLSILLRALNVTIEEVCDALTEGNELPVELLHTLLKMAPTADEELKLRLFTGELSRLGPAERFLKALVDIPFAFKRLEALLFMCTLQEEVTNTKESFEALEVACKELRSSRLFLKILEAVLKTGNRMNVGTFRGGAQAFKLDTLLKLSDVKGTDGKTTLLHFVVQEIVRSEGARAARAARESRSLSNISVRTDDLLEDITPDTEVHYRNLGLQAVSRLSTELENVKKASVIDVDSLRGSVAKLGHSLLKTREFLNKEMKSSDEDSGFHETLKSIVQNAEVDIMSLLEEEKRIMVLVKSTGDYFHGNAGKDEGLRLFIIIRDFLIILDKVCKEVRETLKKSATSQKKEATSSSTSSVSESPKQPPPDLRHRLFPAIAERRNENFSSSSDDES